MASLSIVSHPRLIERFFQHFDTFPPNLNHLSLSPFYPDNEDDHHNPAFSLNIPFHAPTCVLPNVRLTSKNCIPSFDPSFGQHITDVTIDDYRDKDSDGILRIFQSCPNLASFRLGLSSTRSFPTMHSKNYRFSLPFLVTLSISHIWDLENTFSMLSFSSLKCLSLQSFYWSDELSDMFCGVLYSCPSLIRLTLSSNNCFDARFDAHFPHDSPIPLDSLTYLSISCPRSSAYRLVQRLRIPLVQEFIIQWAPWDISHHLTSSCQHLVKLSLNRMHKPIASPIPLSLPTLESLDVRCYSSEHFCPVKLLHIPQLVHLQLDCQCSPNTSIQELLKQSTTRPSLVTLNLHCDQVLPCKTLMYYLDNSPNLEEINLESVSLYDLPPRLPDSSPGRTFLPRLRAIWGRAEILIGILKCRHQSLLASRTESSLPPVSCISPGWQTLKEEHRKAIKVSVD